MKPSIKGSLCSDRHHTHLQEASFCSCQLVGSHGGDPHDDRCNHTPAQSQTPRWKLDHSVGGGHKCYDGPKKDHLNKTQNPTLNNAEFINLKIYLHLTEKLMTDCCRKKNHRCEAPLTTRMPGLKKYQHAFHHNQ